MSTAMASVFEAAQGLSTAIELIKAARAASDALDRAELKFKLAEALEALADAKSSVADAKVELQRAYDELDEKDKALENKKKLVRYLDAYYGIDEQGEPIEDPYCSRCWEVEFTLVHLVRGDRADPFSHCPSCKGKFSRRTTPFDAARHRSDAAPSPASSGTVAVRPSR